MASEARIVTPVEIRRPVEKRRLPDPKRDRWPYRRSKGALSVAAAALRHAIAEYLFGPSIFIPRRRGPNAVATICAEWRCATCWNSGVTYAKNDGRLIQNVTDQHCKKSGAKCKFDRDNVKIRVISRLTVQRVGLSA